MVADVLLWVVVLEALAWTWFLLAWPLFSLWPDRGFGLSKSAAILVLSGPAWTLAWMGVPSLSRSASWTLALLAVGTAAAGFRQRRAAIVDFLRARRADWGLVEGLWLVTFAVFLTLRAARPAIEGAEKFMDFAFLNAAMRSLALPLDDPWLSGFSANYHYFGYVAWSLMARMLGVLPPLAYNLALASLPAAVAAGAFSIGFALAKNRRLAGAAALALIFAGTLACVYQLAIAGRPFDAWTPTRVIPGTINEFPFFSFVWGDLHSHLLAMPSLILFMGLAVAAFDQDAGPKSVALFALMGAASGLSVVTSTWDAAPAGLVAAGVVASRSARFGIRRVAIETCAAVVIALLVAGPALVSVRAGGIRAGVAAGTSPIGSFLLVQGLWLLPSVLLLGSRAANRGLDRPGMFTAATALVAAVTTRSVTVFALVILVMLAWQEFWRTRRGDFLLAASALTLLLLPELVFVDDIYGPELQRMNTVFKLHLQATMMFGLASASWASALWQSAMHRPLWRASLLGTALAAAGLAAVYPIAAIRAWLTLQPAWTLDGSRYLAKDHAGDLAVIAYLNREVPGMPTILEATGEPYSYAARISANTGLPTLVGWANHERVWRRGPEAIGEIRRRVDAVRDLYEGDARNARTMLWNLRVRYVIVGDLEHQTYANGDFAKFEAIGRKLVDVDGTQLYEIAWETNAP